jgi:hypothetical protein
MFIYVNKYYLRPFKITLTGDWYYNQQTFRPTHSMSPRAGAYMDSVEGVAGQGISVIKDLHNDCISKACKYINFVIIGT